MRYTLSNEILEKFPTACLGIVDVRDIDNSNTNNEILKLLNEAHLTVRSNFQNLKISEHPRIRCWREVYSAFGSKPKKYSCSIEAMVKRILENGRIPDINDLVNLYNYMID